VRRSDSAPDLPRAVCFSRLLDSTVTLPAIWPIVAIHLDNHGLLIKGWMPAQSFTPTHLECEGDVFYRFTFFTIAYADRFNPPDHRNIESSAAVGSVLLSFEAGGEVTSVTAAGDSYVSENCERAVRCAAHDAADKSDGVHDAATVRDRYDIVRTGFRARPGLVTRGATRREENDR